MIPVNSDKYKNTCTQIISTSCVRWPDNTSFEILELCKGDSVTDVVYKLTAALEEIKSAYDTSKLTLDCLQDCDLDCDLDCEGGEELHNVINCLISAHCSVNDRLQTLETGTILGLVGDDFVCTRPIAQMANGGGYISDTVWDKFKVTNPIYNDDDLIKYILGLICYEYNETNTRISTLETTSSDHEGRITALELATGSDTDDSGEVNISDPCGKIWTGSRDVSETVGYMAIRLNTLEQALLRNVRPPDLSNCSIPAPIQQLPSCVTSGRSSLVNILDSWGLPVNSFVTAGSLEQKVDNLYSILCNVVTRMTAYDGLEECCRVSCNDVEKAFFITNTTDSYIFTFTFDGQITPPSFISACPTSGLITLTITDSRKTANPSLNNLSISLAVNASEFFNLLKLESYAILKSDPRISGLDTTTDWTIEATGCFRIEQRNGDIKTYIECSFCESTMLPASSNVTVEDCEICTYTIVTDPIDQNIDLEIRYILSGQVDEDIIRITTDQFVLPSSATIVSLTDINGNIDTVTSTNSLCPDLTSAVESLTCFTAFINNDFFNTGGTASRIDVWNIYGWEINGTEYPIDTLISLGDTTATDLIRPNDDGASAVYNTYVIPAGGDSIVSGACNTENIHVIADGSNGTLSDYQDRIDDLTNDTGGLDAFKNIPITIKGTASDVSGAETGERGMRILFTAPAGYTAKLILQSYDNDDSYGTDQQIIYIKAHKDDIDGNECTVCAEPA